MIMGIWNKGPFKQQTSQRRYSVQAVSILRKPKIYCKIDLKNAFDEGKYEIKIFQCNNLQDKKTRLLLIVFVVQKL